LGHLLYPGCIPTRGRARGRAAAVIATSRDSSAGPRALPRFGGQSTANTPLFGSVMRNEYVKWPCGPG
jgi:hypothetical protein